MSTLNPWVPSYYSSHVYHEIGAAEIPVYNPSTLEEIGKHAVTQEAQITDVLASVNAAQKEWAALDAKSRARMLHALADRIEKTPFHDVACQLTREMGKPYPESEGELANIGPIFRYFAELARHDEGHIAGATHPHTLEYSRKHPFGVSVHIMPFNFPLILMVWTLAASLAAGNGAVIKPAEATTLTTLKFMEYFDVLPSGLVACVPGDGQTAQQLIAHEDTHVIAFTGGVETGKKVAVAAAEHLKPVVIEAGGSDPMIISNKTDLDVAVSGAVTAAFHLSGQICVSTERFYVHEDIHDAFVEKFVAETQKLRVGDGFGMHEIGPLVSGAARDKVASLVDGAIRDGATLECGGCVPSGLDTGYYYAPTILSNVSHEMQILTEECFGPVASVIKVKSFEQALSLANKSKFGLGACIFTNDLNEAMVAAEKIESGMVWVNNPMPDNDALPFGGWKNSGMGRALGAQGLDTFRQSKMVFLDYKPTKQEWWYPYPDDWFYGAKGRQEI